MRSTDWIDGLSGVYPTLQQHARVAFAGMLVFVIAYQVWVAIARRRELFLYLNAGWAVAALLMVLGRSIQHATTDTGTVLLGVRIFHTGVLALVPLGLAFAHEIREVPRGRLFWVVVLGTSAPIPLVWLTTWIISDEVQTFMTLTGPILGPVPAPIAPVALPYLAAIAGYLLYVARASLVPRGRLHWRLRLPGDVAYMLLLPALANDVLLYSGRLVTLEIVNVALFLQILVMNAAIFSRAGEYFAGLQESLDERTAELEERERGLSRALESRRQILDAVPDMLCILDEGRIEYVNEAGVRFLGRPREALEGVRLLDAVQVEDAAEAERHLATLGTHLAAGPPVKWQFQREGQGARTAEVTGLALALDGAPRTLVSVHDVTEREHLLERLQVADRLASVGTLAAGVAHEVNNPLTFVSMSLEFIQEALESPAALQDAAVLDELRQHVADCVMGADRIAQIVRDMNTFTRAESERSAVDCRAALEYAVKVASATIRHRASLTLDLGPTPAVLADPRRLSQVFLNLLVNAFQAIPDEDASHEIHVTSLTRADGWAVVEVSDSGIGIAPEVRESVFDPFVTTRRSRGGTGLGLFICRGIVAELGGEIHLSARRPRGTAARVLLPPASRSRAGADAGAPAGVDAGAAVGGAARAASARGGVSSLKVLVADDEPLVLSGLCRMLVDHEVTAVADGEAAIRAMEAERFDVVLCDLMMPGCTGADVWTWMHGRGEDAKFVLMTGGATTDTLRRFTEQPSLRSVAKPVGRRAIESALADAAAAGRPATAG